MARYTGPKNRLSRREGYNLFGSTSRSLERRLNQPPGMQPKGRRRKVSEFAIQLREKQKVKRMFGMLEKQFGNLFLRAARQPGSSGETLLQLLERRLDNVVYRLGFGRTRAMARQLVTHGHVLVNGERAQSPSLTVKPGDVVQLDAKAQQIPVVQETVEDRAAVPGWLQRDGMSGRVVRPPYRDEMEPDIHEQLIVEFYSR